MPRRHAYSSSRVDEKGKPYTADADDAAYATFQLAGGVVAHINSSWDVRVRRDDLVTFQVDGTDGSAVAGLHKCFTQHRVRAPSPSGTRTSRRPSISFRTGEEVPENTPAQNGFKAQWEMFLKHVAEGAPWPYGSKPAPRACNWLCSACKAERATLAGCPGAGASR